MSYNEHAINLDNCDLYEYVTDLEKNEDIRPKQMEHLYVPKINKLRKNSSINMLLIIAIVLILIGIYCYFNKLYPKSLTTETSTVLPDDLLTSYYLR